MLIPSLATLAIALYLAASLLLARPLLGREPPRDRLALGLAGLAVLAHAAIVLGTHRGALDLHFFAALSLTGCLIALLTLVVNFVRPIAALGVLVLPLAAILLGLDVFVAAPTTPQPMDWQIKLHASVALLGYAVLSIAALLALLLAAQERALRSRRLGAWLRALPPITLTETLLFRLIAAGFLLLTLTLVTGVLFVANLFAQHIAHHTVLSIIAWLIFGVLLWGRWRHGWRGRQAVNLTLAGMLILLLAYFGSKFVLELVLQRGH